MTSIHHRNASLAYAGPYPDIFCDVRDIFCNVPSKDFQGTIYGIIEEYGEEIQGSINETHCPDLQPLITKAVHLGKEQLLKLHQNFCRMDACELYDGMKTCRYYYQRIFPQDQLKENFGWLYERLDMALSNKIYKAIIKSLLFSYIGDAKEEASVDVRARDDLMYDTIMHGISKKPIEIRIQAAATYLFRPKDTASSYYVLPTIPYADVAALEISFVTDQSLKDLALRIWSITLVPGLNRDEDQKSYRDKYNKEMIFTMGIKQRRTHDKRITLRQHNASHININRAESKLMSATSKGSMTTLNQLEPPIKAEESLKREKTAADWTAGERLKVIKACLKARANPNPSLLYRCDNMPIIAELLKSIHDVNESDGHKNSALHHCVAYDLTQHVDCLIKFKADVNVQNLDGCTPLHRSISKFKGFAITQRLLEARASVSLQDSLNQTALDYARQLHKTFVELKKKSEKYLNEKFSVLPEDPSSMRLDFPTKLKAFAELPDVDFPMVKFLENKIKDLILTTDKINTLEQLIPRMEAMLKEEEEEKPKFSQKLPSPSSPGESSSSASLQQLSIPGSLFAFLSRPHSASSATPKLPHSSSPSTSRMPLSRITHSPSAAPSLRGDTGLLQGMLAFSLPASAPQPMAATTTVIMIHPRHEDAETIITPPQENKMPETPVAPPAAEEPQPGILKKIGNIFCRCGCCSRKSTKVHPEG